MYYPREEQNLYKKQLAAAKPNKSTLTIQLQINSNKSTLTTQLRLNFDIPPIERHVFCQKYHSRPIKN